MAKQVFFRRKKACPFSGEDGLKIDYKDVKLLSRYISEKGKSFRAVSLPFLLKNKESWPEQSNVLVISVCFRLWHNKLKERKLWKLSFWNMLIN